MTTSPSPPERVRLVVVFGGQSAEHDVSCVSARHVLAAANTDRYDVVPLGITREGNWVRANDAAAALRAGVDALPDYLIAAGPSVDALPALADPASVAGSDADSSPMPTVVLPVLHGPMGEDGTIQGLLEMAGVPYAGAGVLASALCMDKVACKDHLRAHGVPQGRYQWFTVDEGVARDATDTSRSIDEAAAAALDDLGSTVFVKPANMGSSVGVSRATTVEEAADAIRLAAGFDRIVIIEEEIRGREIEIAVLGNESPVASVGGEIVPGADFYDYEDKYEDGAELLVPAPLDSDELAALQRLAISAYRSCRVEGLARVDFFYEDGSRDPAASRGWLVNEINTMPGFTPISMYPKMWAASGVDYPTLIDRLVALALERHDRNQRHSRTDR